MRHGKQLLIVDVQEILVNNQMMLKFGETINPYNPEAYEYFKTRNRSAIIKNIEYNKQKQNLLKIQDGICTLCNGMISDTERVEIDHIIAKIDGGSNKTSNLRLVHATCHKQKTAVERRMRAIMRKREGMNNTKAAK